MSIPSVESAPQFYARSAGILFLVSLVAGALGEMYLPGQLIVSGDAAQTAEHLRTMGPVFRMAYACYLVEAICDVGLTLLLFVLFKPVHREIALLATLFRIVSTATFAIAEFFYFSAPVFTSGAAYLKSFTPAQLDSFAYLSLKLYGIGSAIFMVFYGISCLLTGYLMYKSGYLPKILGALLALGGLGFIVNNFMFVLAPAYASALLVAPMGLAALALIPWLLIKGVQPGQPA